MKTTLKTLMLATLLAGTSSMAMAQAVTLRATANSNENDEILPRRILCGPQL